MKNDRFLPKECALLFGLFFKIGCTTFGGGYAMLPILKRELCETRPWFCEDEILRFYAIGQATPGIIAVNTATFVGYDRAGWTGAWAATLGLIAPSILIISFLYPWVGVLARKFFYAALFIKWAVLAVVLDTLYGLVCGLGRKIFAWFVAFVSFGLALFGVSLPLIIGGWIVLSLAEGLYAKTCR